MKKNAFYLSFVILILSSCISTEKECLSSEQDISFSLPDSLISSFDWPAELEISSFTGPKLTPSPACLAVSPDGGVFVGVDMMGSLGKEMGKGFIKKIVDCDHDGVPDSFTVFAEVNNPRGIIAIGSEVFVLHTTFSEETKKATNMDLVVFSDVDEDGIADGPAKILIKNISNPKYLADRGTDHATNGIQLGIDGWIYIAVGDFGFHNATGTDGKQLTMLGGGVVRVRPDGTEMEVYTHGLRNIYDVAIDPFMNIFTRGNTNDGGGWNVRFIHHIQSAEYGYPVLFKHFTEEIIPALVDVGGGSGTGALFLNDHRWPDKYNNVPMMADWGRSQLYIHRVEKDESSFTQIEEKFLKIPQITDLDIDGSGVLFISAWDGAGYSGSPKKGFVVRAIPKEFTYKPFPKLSSLSNGDLVELLTSNNAKSRQAAQYELLNRKADVLSKVADIIEDTSLSMEVRVAALFTYAQLSEGEGIEQLSKWAEIAELKEFALRAMSDRKIYLRNLSSDLFIKTLNDGTDRQKSAAIVGLGRIGDKAAIKQLFSFKVPSKIRPSINMEGPHATANSEIVLPHLAVQTLVKLNAVEESLDEIKSGNYELGIWAIKYLHSSESVEGLIEIYSNTDKPLLRKEILNTLSRLYFKEAPYDASWWWSTRPDTHGPYYKTVEWDFSPMIRSFLISEWKKANKADRKLFSEMNSKYRLGIDEFGLIENKKPKEDVPIVDFDKIKGKKGQIGKSSIEDVMIALKQVKGTQSIGEGLFKTQGCIACHSLSSDEVMKGPFMGQIGSIMNKEQIAESILKPNASISQGFSTYQIKTTSGDNYLGFITEESSTSLTIRNIAGIATTIKKDDISTKEEFDQSMMPAGLANSLSYEEFASLIKFLESKK